MRGAVRRARGVSVALAVVVGLFIAQVAMAADTVVDDPSFFDDVLSYLEHIISIPPG